MTDAGARRLLEEAEADVARATERLVASEGFAELLARVVANLVALYRVTSTALDLVIRHLRLAGRQDVTRLGRQIGRAEDKLERVLQEVETLQERPPAEATGPAGRSNRQAAVGGSAVTALVVATVLLVLHPPSLSGGGEVVALAVGVLALVVTTAWATLWVAGRSKGGPR